MSLRSIRGATTVENNSKFEILEGTQELLKKIIDDNNLEIEDVISIIFTCTRDLNAVYPAVSARELGVVDAALMCFDELYIDRSLKMCIRVMVNIVLRGVVWALH